MKFNGLLLKYLVNIFILLWPKLAFFKVQPKAHYHVKIRNDQQKMHLE